MRKAAAFSVSLLVTLGLLLLAELGVRLAGVEPLELATAQLPGFPGMRVHPMLGPLPEPGWSGDWFGAFAVEVDAHGFRSAGPQPAPGDAARVVLMGDSCTFGWGVDTPDTFFARIGLQGAGAAVPLEVLNAAYPGHSAVVGVQVLRELVRPLSPEVIVLGYSANNAFRLAIASDAERFRCLGVRRWVIRSRLLRATTAWLAGRRGPPTDPRDRAAVAALPPGKLRRVAAGEEFEAALRTLAHEARVMGAAPLMLVFPRSAIVSAAHQYEDAAASVRNTPLPPRVAGAPIGHRELGLLEASCLDVRRTDVLGALHERAREWQPVYPADPLLRAQLAAGAEAYTRGDLTAARRIFDAAVAAHPASPLARYDRGVAAIAAGDAAPGLLDLEEADRLACSVFLHYQVRLWRIALALEVPVVDLTLWFQSRDGEELFLDPAHPNQAGQAVIAEALWPALQHASPVRSRAPP